MGADLAGDEGASCFLPKNGLALSSMLPGAWTLPDPGHFHGLLLQIPPEEAPASQGSSPGAFLGLGT